MVNAKQDQKSGDYSLSTHAFSSLFEVRADFGLVPDFR